MSAYNIYIYISKVDHGGGVDHIYIYIYYINGTPPMNPGLVSLSFVSSVLFFGSLILWQI